MYRNVYLDHRARIRNALAAVDVVIERIGFTSVPELAAKPIIDIVITVDDPAVDEYLLLRDHLRSDAADRALYESTKKTRFSEQWDDMNAYADAKTSGALRALR